MEFEIKCQCGTFLDGTWETNANNDPIVDVEQCSACYSEGFDAGVDEEATNATATEEDVSQTIQELEKKIEELEMKLTNGN